MEKMKMKTPKSLNFTKILYFFKKLLWFVLAVFIVLNIALFYFLNGVIYFLAIIVWNVVLFWLMIPVTIWVGKTFLIDTWLEVAEEIKENISKIANDKIVRIIEKKEK